jgi:hypothetical protein
MAFHLRGTVESTGEHRESEMPPPPPPPQRGGGPPPRRGGGGGAGGGGRGGPPPPPPFCKEGVRHLRESGGKVDS